ncbi:MAG TPA: DUF3284 domain-containing protein [Patescibacteria group bacterium]
MNDNRLKIIINKPLAEVFEFCVTPPHAKLWVPNIINETTNQWPAKIGTVYTEYKNDNTSFNIIVTDYKENEYIEWKTEDGKYHVRYTFTPVNQNATQLEYVENGEVTEPFTQEILEKLKQVIENASN